MDIHILPSHVANMIAAGEVVQRPASVVKELMENSVDAGATRVQVIVTDAGRTLIQVIDNGCGMNPDDAVVCFQRHATSKIATAEDIENINTFGFRGEALPSIAAVSELTLRTRPADQELATQVTISGATVFEAGDQDIAQVAAPVGTNVAVRNLFYNTPARRKFLKSDASELKAIINEYIRVALTRTDISFSLSSNGRDILNLSPASSLKYRIRDIFGENAADELLEIQTESQYASLKGFVSRPDSARKTSANQFLFVNGRYFRSPYLHKAVMKAYEFLIPEGYSPSYYIYMEVSPGAFDVNVHPTKTEIKFEDDNVLFAILSSAVKETLGRRAVGDRLDFEAGELPSLHQVGPSFEEYKGPAAPPAFNSSADFNPFEGDGFPNEKWYDRRPSLHNQDISRLFDSTLPAHPCVGEGRSAVVCGRFIIASGQSGVLLVDSRRASRRIFYDRFLESLERGGTSGQGRLFSVEVEIGPDNMPLVARNEDLLRSMGFSFSPIGPGTLRVDSVPDGLVDDPMGISAFIYETVNALGEEGGPAAASVYAPLAQKLAASAARAALCPSDEAGARDLLDKLYMCENPDFTPEGHRIVTVLGSADLENLLK